MPGDNNNGLPAIVADDRRTGHRFPLRLAVRYRSTDVRADWTLGESVNISSAGLLFTTPEAVAPGQTIEASISWPVFLDDHVPLKLIVKGPIVRSEGDMIAMCFGSYEFKTCLTPSEPNTTSRGL